MSESSNQGTMATAKPRGTGKLCVLCGSAVPTHMKRHMLSHHLPWYLDPTRACWECESAVNSFPRHLSSMTIKHRGTSPHFTNSHFALWCQLVYGLLIFIRNHLQLPKVDDILSYVIENSIFPQDYAGEPFSSSEIDLLRVLCNMMGLEEVEVFKITPPNHVACILHWKILAEIATTFDIETRELFQNYNLPVETPSELSTAVLDSKTYIDSHCHLDKLIKNSKFKDFLHLRDTLGRRAPHLVCITNYVFPPLWSLMARQIGDSPDVHCTVGVHPHFVKPGGEEGQKLNVARLLTQRRFVGLGEVGLDFTTACRCKPACRNSSLCKQRKEQAQRTFLRAILPLAAQHDLALVLHCRDHGDGSAAEEVRQLIIELELHTLRIHRHCFVGGVEELNRWLSSFPNVKFGFTNTILTDSVTAPALQELDIDRILLETDSPYLPAKRGRTNTPWQIESVARRVAEIKNIPLALLISKCNDNASRMYKLV